MKRKLITIIAAVMMIVMCACAQTGGDGQSEAPKEEQKQEESAAMQYGADYVKTHVAVPGYSEHHTGLALDLYLVVDGKDVVENEDLESYPEIWAKIHEKLPKYGFILRFPEGKKDITGVAYEPWHIRYIDSPEIAQEITDSGLTFEEYIEEKNAGSEELDDAA